METKQWELTIYLDGKVQTEYFKTQEHALAYTFYLDGKNIKFEGPSLSVPKFIIIKEDELESEDNKYYCTYDSTKPALQDWHVAIGEWNDGRYVVIETNSKELYPLGYTIKPRK